MVLILTAGRAMHGFDVLLDTPVKQPETAGFGQKFVHIQADLGK
jgi:hypothetical protein